MNRKNTINIYHIIKCYIHMKLIRTKYETTWYLACFGALSAVQNDHPGHCDSLAASDSTTGGRSHSASGRYTQNGASGETAVATDLRSWRLGCLEFELKNWVSWDPLQALGFQISETMNLWISTPSCSNPEPLRQAA